MSQPIIGREIIRLDSVDSTNTYLMSLAAQGAEEGLVVIADRQTAGRGRRGRSRRDPDRGSRQKIGVRNGGLAPDDERS